MNTELEDVLHDSMEEELKRRALSVPLYAGN